MKQKLGSKVSVCVSFCSPKAVRIALSLQKTVPIRNLTWLFSSIPAIIFVYLVPALRSILEGKTLQILALLLAGTGAVFFVNPNYVLLALTLLGSAGAGIVDGNTPAMLADSQEKYAGTTPQLFVNLVCRSGLACFKLGGIVHCAVQDPRHETGVV